MNRTQTKKATFSCDFETTTDPNDCRVWAYFGRNVFNEEEKISGNNIDDFMQFLNDRTPKVYFHNLKFDGKFILYWLLTHGYTYSKERLPHTFNSLISKEGLFYEIEIVFDVKGRKRIATQIYDSLKKIPLPVKATAYAYKLPIHKTNIDYKKFRPVGYKLSSKEEEYISNDATIIAQALKMQFDQGMTKMTAGADAYDEYKNDKKIGIGANRFKQLFPQITPFDDLNLRKAYRGGFTWVNPVFQGKDLGAGMVFDVNSLYPSRMYNELLPYGAPMLFDEKYEKNILYPLYVQHLTCSLELKKDHVPSLQVHDDPRFNGREYVRSTNGDRVELTLSNVDLDLLFDEYDVIDPEFLGGYMFKGARGLFKDYIDYWMGIKEKSTGGMRTIAKLKLNSLYGKFATKPDVTGRIPTLDDNGILKLEVGEEERRDPVYLPMGLFITAYARNYTIRTAQKVQSRIIYCDTDSIHLIETEVPKAIKDIVHPTKLGFWKHESTFIRGRFLRAKCYIEDYGNDENGNKLPLHVRCAGMPDSIKKKVTWDNFHFGFTSYGKLVPKDVVGGVVLEDRPFTLLEDGGLFG